MITLGIDSSTDHLGAGISDGSRVLGEDIVKSAREHASQIIGLIDSVLNDCLVSRQQLEAVAVAVGPGSFTGLRVGLAAAKGLVMALELPLIGVSTFEVISRRLAGNYEKFFLAAPVRRGEFYLYSSTAGIPLQDSILIVSEGEIIGKVGECPIGFLGRLSESLAEKIPRLIDPIELYISGGELALLGAERLKSGFMNDPDILEPLYIAPSQAEHRFDAK